MSRKTPFTVGEHVVLRCPIDGMLAGSTCVVIDASHKFFVERPPGQRWVNIMSLDGARTLTVTESVLERLPSA